MKPRVVTVVQARMGSTRLPGKVMLPVGGRPVLELMLERVLAARRAGTVVLAVPEGPTERPLVDLGARLGVACYRGDAYDLLDRHVEVARRHGANVVVKIPSDCPLIDPGVIDRVVGAFLADPAAFDYVSNLHPATYPDGNDVEVMSLAALETAWRNAVRPLEREHTTPYLWDNPERFRLGNVEWETGRDLSMSHRFTLDYAEDLAFIAAVYERLQPRDPLFGLDAILALLEAEPELSRINARHAGVNWYRHHLDELRTITAEQTRSSSAART